MQVTPYTAKCGALVEDIQLATLDDTQLQELRGAFRDHGLLFFRDQELTPDEHLRFARRFGDIVVNKFFARVDGYTEIAEVRKEKTQTMNIGGGWHTDHSYDEIPAMGSILVARNLPDSGGDTWFANPAEAYTALSPELKEKVGSLRAIHSNVHLYGEDGFYTNSDLAEQLGGMDRVGDATHPMVIKHPESGRPVLYVNPGHTIGIEGWSTEDAMKFLHELYDHVTQPEFTCEFQWQPGSVVLWDNRCTWHFAQNDYQGKARLMHRITLAGSALSAY